MKNNNKCYARTCDSNNIDNSCMYGNAKEMPCKNRSRKSDVAQAGVQAGMSYYINNTMSMALLPHRRHYAWNRV